MATADVTIIEKSAILSRRMDERNHFAWRGVECAPSQEGERVVGSSGYGIDCGKVDAPYRSARTRNWVKVKCTRRQEFVVIGWKRSSAKGRPFSSLLLAQNEAGKLTYKGKVGTGFSLDEIPDLAAKLARLARKTPPAQVDKVTARGVTWVKPELVAEIAFAEFTADGNIRHGSYLGMRADKAAAAVKPEVVSDTPHPQATVEISSRDRVIFPDSGQTKGDLADYYAQITPLMLPYAAQRPISLVRCPQGRGRKCFFQKHDSGSFGDHVHHVPIPEKGGTSEDYLYIDDAAGILACTHSENAPYCRKLLRWRITGCWWARKPEMS